MDILNVCMTSNPFNEAIYWPLKQGESCTTSDADRTWPTLKYSPRGSLSRSKMLSNHWFEFTSSSELDFHQSRVFRGTFGFERAIFTEKLDGNPYIFSHEVPHLTKSYLPAQLKFWFGVCRQNLFLSLRMFWKPRYSSFTDCFGEEEEKEQKNSKNQEFSLYSPSSSPTHLVPASSWLQSPKCS